MSLDVKVGLLEGEASGDTCRIIVPATNATMRRGGAS